MKKIFKFKAEYLYVLVFVVLVVGFLSIAINSVIDKFIPEETSASSSEKIDVDWESLYPFDDVKDDTNYVIASQSLSIRSIISSYKAITKSLSGYVGSHFDYLLSSENIKSVGIKTRKILNSNLKFSQDSLQQIDNGQIINIEKYDENYGKEMISYCWDFNNYLQSKDIPLLYVQTLTKYDETEKYKSYVNENRDLLLNGLNNKGVDTLDLREFAQKQSLTVDDCFYKTDHHWKTTMGLWATNNIVNTLNSNYNLKFENELLNVNNYDLITYKNVMFGSYGNSAGLDWVDTEDHYVYYPKFETQFNIEIKNKNINDTGTFNEVLFNNKKIKELENGNAGYAYETTCYGNTPLTKITNLNNKNAPRILVIRDSFGLAILPYLSCVCSEVDSIDLRKSNGNFNGSIRTYIEDFNPDAIIIIYSEAYPYMFK
jgi:hypothetical protein